MNMKPLNQTDLAALARVLCILDRERVTGDGTILPRMDERSDAEKIVSKILNAARAREYREKSQTPGEG